MNLLQFISIFILFNLYVIKCDLMEDLADIKNEIRDREKTVFEWDCSDEQKESVVEIWTSVYSAMYDGRRSQIAIAVFERIFARSPGTTHLFAKYFTERDTVTNFKLKMHIMLILSGLDQNINSAYYPESLEYNLNSTGKGHAKRKSMKAKYFDVMVESFSDIFGQLLSGFDSESWNACMFAWSDRMKEAFKAQRIAIEDAEFEANFKVETKGSIGK